MKLPIYDTQNKKTGEKALPAQFQEPVREDLIRRAVRYVQNVRRSTYGADPMAGKKTSVRLSKRRHDYRGAYGRGQSRVPRKIVSRRGTQINLEAAFAPGTVKGRRAHPPKSSKNRLHKINLQESYKALRSALTASLNTTLVAARNHQAPSNYPFLLAGDFENIDKAKTANVALKTIGFEKELSRTKKPNIRAGKGKLRGRKYTSKKGPLIVVSQECPLAKAARNIAGCDIVMVNQLNCEDLAPGSQPGRVTLYTEQAIDAIDKNKLFMFIEANRAAPEKPSKTVEPVKKDKKETKIVAKPAEKLKSKPKTTSTKSAQKTETPKQAKTPANPVQQKESKPVTNTEKSKPASQSKNTKA